MSKIAAPSPRLREQTAAALAPFFMEGPGSDADIAGATATAAQLLEDYDPQTPKELQLAAQIVAFSFAALACLGAAATVRVQDLDVMLDLQDSAIALDTLSEKSTKALEARRRERERAPDRMSAANTQWDNAAFQSAIGRALEKFLYASSKIPAVREMPEKPAVAEKPAKLPILSAEPMTLSVLARRGNGADDRGGRRSAPRTRQ
nr:hypothetical protein [uncultured Rhodopila sp.]